MRKDNSKVSEWAKHTRNTKYGRRGINKRNRKNTKEDTTQQLADTLDVEIRYPKHKPDGHDKLLICRECGEAIYYPCTDYVPKCCKYWKHGTNDNLTKLTEATPEEYIQANAVLRLYEKKTSLIFTHIG